MVIFGSDNAPKTDLRMAVAASSAVPLVYQPVTIDGHHYVDGGIASGTSAHLVFEYAKKPLDFILIIAPMAADAPRDGARFYEGIFDRLGAEALAKELELIESTWPESDVVILRPNDHVLSAARPNPMSVEASIPTFLRTLAYLRRELAQSHVWDMLRTHLVS